MILLRDVDGNLYYFNASMISYARKENATKENIAGYDGFISSLKLTTGEKIFFPHELGILYDILKERKVILDDFQFSLVKLIGEKSQTPSEAAAHFDMDERALLDIIDELDELQPRLISEDYGRNDGKYLVLTEAGRLFAEGKLLYVSNPEINDGG